jgi:hypothetical protein
MRNRTHGLKDLAERLEKAIDRIANDGTIDSAVIEFFLWKLHAAADQLARRLEADRAQVLADLQSDLRTSGF